MHEVALAQELVQLIERIAQDHNAIGVNRALVEVGEIAGIVPEALEFAFEFARTDTIANRCTLEFRHVALHVRCTACGYHGGAERGVMGCPRCDAIPIEVTAGREMRLVSIDVEDSSDA